MSNVAWVAGIFLLLAVSIFLYVMRKTPMLLKSGDVIGHVYYLGKMKILVGKLIKEGKEYYAHFQFPKSLTETVELKWRWTPGTETQLTEHPMIHTTMMFPEILCIDGNHDALPIRYNKKRRKPFKNIEELYIPDPEHQGQFLKDDAGNFLFNTLGSVLTPDGFVDNTRLAVDALDDIRATWAHPGFINKMDMWIGMFLGASLVLMVGESSGQSSLLGSVPFAMPGLFIALLFTVAFLMRPGR